MELQTIHTDIFGDRVKRKGQINHGVKGKKNERECASTLTLWTGAAFTRTPNSGGLRWEHSQGVAADLVCEDPDFYFPFSIETKHLKEFGPYAFSTIWKQAHGDGIRSGKIPMCLVRKNRDKGFKLDDVPYVDYLMLLDVRYVGSWLALKLKPVYKNHFSKSGYTLIGFKLSEVIAAVKYTDLAHAVEKGSFVAKFMANETPNI